MDAQLDAQRFHTDSPEETQEIGRRVAEELVPGSVVAFRGDLGAGKTCMIQGLCRAMGVEGYVTSPTFILINEYTGKLQGHSIEIYHFDLYRLGAADELEDLGADEYFYGQGICLIEWPERAHDLLPARRLDIVLEYAGESERIITLDRLTD
jgi:tRNA threonylcarbamoyladenosine biosynthesis protein TsaE